MYQMDFDCNPFLLELGLCYRSRADARAGRGVGSGAGGGGAGAGAVGNGAGSWMELFEIAAAVKANISLLCEAQSGQVFTL